MRAYDPNTEELYHIAGDAPDPSGTELLGMQSSIQASRPSTRVMVRYRDVVLEIDVYQTKESLAFNLLCPRCRHSLWIRAEQKSIEWNGKMLSVEPFGCTWELDDDRHQFGMNLCNWKVAIDNNIAKDA
jgi:hypothetical protein